jgi:hypothetical protein
LADQQLQRARNSTAYLSLNRQVIIISNMHCSWFAQNAKSGCDTQQ